MSIETIALGGDGGRSFDMQAVQSLGFRSGSRIDAMILNGNHYGGYGGTERKQITLAADEYISDLTVHYGSRVYGVFATTNRGRTVGAGHAKGNKTEFKDVRIVGLGGKNGSELDKLRVRYVPNYSASTLVDRGLAVIGTVPQGKITETFTSSRVSQLSATRLFMESVFSFEHSSEAGVSVPLAKADFMGKTNTTFGMTLTTQTEFTEQIETEIFESTRETYSPPKGHVGLEVVSVDVFKADGRHGVRSGSSPQANRQWCRCHWKTA